MSGKPTTAEHKDHRLALKGSDWLCFCERQPHLDRLCSEELLALGDRALAGNLRYAPDREGVVLLGEVRVAGWQQAIDQGARQLLRQVAGDIENNTPEDELVESALAACGLSWNRRETSWVVQVPGSHFGEIIVEPRRGGSICRVVLASWAHPPETAVRAAVSEALFRAHAGLRLVRCGVQSDAAWIQSFAPNEQLDGLSSNLVAVARASHLLAAEIRALQSPELARRYLELEQLLSKS